jgi:uncharacterized membrane protein YdcZ (DUF606 family)
MGNYQEDMGNWSKQFDIQEKHDQLLKAQRTTARYAFWGGILGGIIVAVTTVLVALLSK